MIRGCFPPTSNSAKSKTPPVSCRCHPPRRGGLDDVRGLHKTSVGRDDSARRGRHCNNCNSYNVSRVLLNDIIQIRNSELKFIPELWIRNKVNSFGIINWLYTAAAVGNSLRLASRATSLQLREARGYCKFLALFAIIRNCELYIILGFYDNLRISTNLGSLKWRELSAKLTEGVPARRRRQELQWM